MSDSIFKSSVRAFFVTLFVMFAFAFGLIPIFGVIGGLAGLSGEFEVKTHYSQMIAPNAEGVRKQLPESAPVILKLSAEGMIGTELLNAQNFRRQLMESREGKLADGRVKAILIDINTPGGTVTDSNGIYKAIKEYKQLYKVPVYAYVDGMCASGGMWVACACDKVFATDVSIIGSVGVLSQPFFNFTGLMEKVGVEAKTLTAGKGKDDMNPFRKWKKGEDDAMVNLIDAMYNQFLDIIVLNRPKISRDLLIKEYGANVFTADKAKEIGYIDEIVSSSGDVLTLLANEIGIEDSEYQVVQMESKFWLSSIVNSKSPLLTGKVKHQLETTSENIEQLKYLYSPN